MNFDGQKKRRENEYMIPINPVRIDEKNNNFASCSPRVNFPSQPTDEDVKCMMIEVVNPNKKTVSVVLNNK